jgi:hypothetical protein
MLDQPGLILAHPEEIVLLRDLTDRTKTVRALSLGEILLRPESFAGDTVPTLIIVLIDLPTIVKILEDLLNDLLVADFCCADEVIIGDSEPLPERLEAFDHFIAVSFWIHSPLLCCLLNLLTMFICTGEEKNLTALQPFVTGEDVSGDGGVGMADMGDIIDIVDRGGDVESSFRFRMHGW